MNSVNLRKFFQVHTLFHYAHLHTTHPERCVINLRYGMPVNKTEIHRKLEKYQTILKCRPKETEILGWTSTQPRPQMPAQPQHSTTQSSPQRAPAPTTTPHEDNDGFTRGRSAGDVRHASSAQWEPMATSGPTCTAIRRRPTAKGVVVERRQIETKRRTSTGQPRGFRHHRHPGALAPPNDKSVILPQPRSLPLCSRLGTRCYSRAQAA